MLWLFYARLHDIHVVIEALCGPPLPENIILFIISISEKANNKIFMIVSEAVEDIWKKFGNW